MFIEDRTTDYRISFYDLATILDSPEPGEYSWSRDFNDGWIVTPTQECKIDSILIDYIVPEIHKEEILISLEGKTKAIVENATKNEKHVVFTDGTKQEWNN